MGYHVTLTEDRDGNVVAHDPSCPQVAVLRTQGRPLATLFDCEGKLPDDLRKHDCLKGEKR